MEYVQLENTYISMTSHDLSECAGSACAMHNRTNHHMRDMRQIFWKNEDIMCRICVHGFKHPDPDDLQVLSGEYTGKHECDACCIRFASEEECSGGSNR